MGKVIALSEEHYRLLERAAADRGQTPEDLVGELIDGLHGAGQQRAYETEEWFRHLGASDEQIAESERLARQEADDIAHADA